MGPVGLGRWLVGVKRAQLLTEKERAGRMCFLIPPFTQSGSTAPPAQRPPHTLLLLLFSAGG